jgi:hypothetical protein
VASFDPLAAYLAADALLDCAVTALARTVDGAPAKRFVAFGEVPLDSCCDGLLWVRLTRAINTEPFPVESVDTTKCLTAVPAGTFEVVVARCVPVPGARGMQRAQGIDPAASDDLARRTLADVWALQTGLSCCLLQWTNDVLAPRRSAFMGTDVIGPQGGCLMVATTVMLELGSLGC